jgi:YD repeat-containing protein
MEIVSPVRKDRVTFSYYSFFGYTRQSIFNVNNDFVATEEWVDNYSQSFHHNSYIYNYAYPTHTRPCVTFPNNSTMNIYTQNAAPTPSNFSYIRYGDIYLYSYPPTFNYGTTPTLIRSDESRVQTIETDNEVIEFTGQSQINTILVKDKRKSNAVLRTIVFYAGDFGIIGGASPYEPKRSKLDSVQIQDSEGKVIEKYKFDYYGDGGIPASYTFDYDHWGYFNAAGNDNNYNSTYTGTPQFKSGVPSMTVSVNHYGKQLSFPIGNSNHEPSSDPNMVNMGTLKSITYPTGRTSTFTYEVNQYEFKHYSGTNFTLMKKYAGGLRIKRINESEPNGASLSTTYTYGGGNESEGYGIPFRDITNDDYVVDKFFYEPTPHDANNTSFARIYNPYPAGQTAWEGGAPVVYSRVTETKGMSRAQSRTVYEYATPVIYEGTHPFVYTELFSFILGASTNPTIYTNLRTDLAPEKDDGWQCGQLLKKTEYRYEGREFLPARITNYQYHPVFRLSEIKGRKVYQTIKQRNWEQYRGNNSASNMEELEARSCYPFTYTIDTGAKRLKRESVTTYPSGDGEPVVETIEYSYANNKHLYPTQIEVSTSDGKTRTETMLYPLDVASPSPAVSELKNSRRWKTLIQKDITRGDASWQTKFDYITAGDKVLLQNIWDGKPASIENRLQIISTDQYGNPLQIRKDEATNLVFLWGYNGQYPVAEIVGVTYSDVTAKISETTLTSIATKSQPTSSDLTLVNNLRTQLPNAQVTTYTYKPLIGIQTVIDPSGVKTTYEYDAFGRLSRIKDENNKTIENYEYQYKN